MIDHDAWPEPPASWDATERLRSHAYFPWMVDPRIPEGCIGVRVPGSDRISIWRDKPAGQKGMEKVGEIPALMLVPSTSNP